MPFIFKNLVDALGETSQAAAAAGLEGAAPLDASVTVPFAMVLGYGIARSTASGAQEVTDHRETRCFVVDTNSLQVGMLNACMILSDLTIAPPHSLFSE